MKYLSTFSGIGGFELGINKAYEQLCDDDRSEDGGEQENQTYDERQGFLAKEGEKISAKNRPVSERPTNFLDERPLCIGYYEVNKYAIQIYQKHFPNHKNYGDITKINAKELPDFDLFVGGFPCQAFSIAGKRGGFDDTRGTLFFDCARILKEKQPRNFILENVKGLLSHDNGRTFKTIINTLIELGYCVEWQVLNAKNFGVPQNRERVFIVGHLGGIPERKVFPITRADREVDETSGLQSVSNPRELSRTLLARDYKDPKVVIQQLNNPTHSNDRVYGTDGISPTLNTMQGGNRQPFIKIPEATKLGYAIAEEGDSINLSVPDSKTRRGRVGHGIAQTIDTGMQQHTLSSDMRIRRLTPLECERLMGYPDGWTEGLSDTQRYKTLGNGVVSNVVQIIVEKLFSFPRH